MINLTKTVNPNRNTEYYGYDMHDVWVLYVCKAMDKQHRRYEEAERQRKQAVIERRARLLHLA